MKYGSLKRQESKSFKISALDGGIDYSKLPDSIADNCIASGKNMWYKNSRLQTRPGFKADAESALDTTIYGYTGELEYDITDTVIYRYGNYYRIATANITTDDYAHYIYVYLVDLYGNMIPIGNLVFLRLASDTFYMPVHINFFNGKPQTGGGIYAMVSLSNKHNYTQKSHCIYEINAEFTEWERVYDYYIPTSLINGRGNNYQIAKNESGFSSAAPISLEAQNMLDGRFYSYFTSDGYSTSFRLPYNNIASEDVIIRIYYSLEDYVEWVIGPKLIRDVKEFYDKEITAYVDRSTGTVYFTEGPADYAIPVMSMFGINNIKVTASKEITNGVAKIVESPCTVRHNSKLLVAGGSKGNTVYTADYDNPLYFPKTSAVDVGEGNSGITSMSSQQGKVVVFKNDELHLITVKEGETVNETTLLTDNDKVFRKADTLTCEQISGSIGCDNKATVSLCDGRTLWLGGDNKVYGFDVSGKKISEVFSCPELGLDSYLRLYAKAIGGGGYYFLVSGEKIAVADISSLKNVKIFYWETPEGINIESGFFFAGQYGFLCTGSDSRLAYIATLEGKSDSILYFDGDEELTIMHKDIPINCELTTKHYCFSDKKFNKNIEGIYFNLSAKGRVKMAVNDRYKTDVNFGFLNEDYDKCEYKSVRLSPHLYNTDGVALTIGSDSDISIGEIEIQYRVTG